MPDVEFYEEQKQSNLYNTGEIEHASSLVRWLIKRGIVSSASQALYAAVIFAVLCMIAAGAIMMYQKNRNVVEDNTPTELEPDRL